MVYNIEQIKKKRNSLERIYQGYHGHSFKHVHVNRRQEQAIHVYLKRSNAENVVKYRANKK